MNSGFDFSIGDLVVEDSGVAQNLFYPNRFAPLALAALIISAIAMADPSVAETAPSPDQEHASTMA